MECFISVSRLRARSILTAQEYGAWVYVNDVKVVEEITNNTRFEERRGGYPVSVFQAE